MTIAFTICSINYLAQAQTLGDSLRQTNPAIQFYIGLVDKLHGSDLDLNRASGYPLIEVDKIGIARFGEMCERYNITELNTAVKPFYFTYFHHEFPEAAKVIYFDPDIIVFNSLRPLEARLEEFDAVVTPHITTPISDTKTPNELHHLNTGIFNLGFLALRLRQDSLQFLKWWEEKLRHECLIDLCNGLFVDQNWASFLPLFVKKTFIEKHPGYNAAYWNLHERTFAKERNIFLVNGSPLVFFHYSGYDPGKPEILSKYQDRFQLSERKDLAPLFELYRTQLLANGNDYYRRFKCFYIKPEKVLRYQRVRKLARLPLETLAKKLDTF